ncbi:hypothetical protein RFI_16401 [Reticulomyxa filosa]|uniref:Uncharacterized protein n=1 Tax=Reticulomyxa filosa TaxID=46433 RepID=X6N469_RETFI|nr:hypothetical protein RFI_16401 [Reticulomyxa filosa]|eukprot:ETO20816.1 hypothetical protein RFI_16401 [Reticulomyxa filosa]
MRNKRGTVGKHVDEQKIKSKITFKLFLYCVITINKKSWYLFVLFFCNAHTKGYKKRTIWLCLDDLIEIIVSYGKKNKNKKQANELQNKKTQRVATQTDATATKTKK